MDPRLLTITLYLYWRTATRVLYNKISTTQVTSQADNHTPNHTNNNSSNSNINRTEQMCFWQWVTSSGCAMRHDPELGHRRLRTKSGGFFQHGRWQKRTAGCSRAQDRHTHCPDERTERPRYRDLVASAQAGDQHFFVWDPSVTWRTDGNGRRVLDERCGPCRKRENAR